MFNDTFREWCAYLIYTLLFHTYTSKPWLSGLSLMEANNTQHSCIGVAAGTLHSKVHKREASRRIIWCLSTQNPTRAQKLNLKNVTAAATALKQRHTTNTHQLSFGSGVFWGSAAANIWILSFNLHKVDKRTRHHTIRATNVVKVLRLCVRKCTFVRFHPSHTRTST